MRSCLLRCVILYKVVVFAEEGLPEISRPGYCNLSGLVPIRLTLSELVGKFCVGFCIKKQTWYQEGSKLRAVLEFDISMISIGIMVYSYSYDAEAPGPPYWEIS